MPQGANKRPRKKISCGGVSISSFSFPNESSIISEVQNVSECLNSSACLTEVSHLLVDTQFDAERLHR